MHKSGSSEVSKETRGRITRIADELGYTPNYSARALVGKGIFDDDGLYCEINVTYRFPFCRYQQMYPDHYIRQDVPMQLLTQKSIGNSLDNSFYIVIESPVLMVPPFKTLANIPSLGMTQCPTWWNTAHF